MLSFCEFKKGTPTKEELIAEAKYCWKELGKILTRHSIPLAMNRMKYKNWRRKLIHYSPTRKANPELYAIVDELSVKIGVRRPRVITLNPILIPFLNISELKAAIASDLLETSDICDGVLRMKNQAVKVIDTVDGILAKVSEDGDRDVLQYISAHISYCANLLKDMMVPEIVGTDAYKSYICKTNWMYQCWNDFDRYVYDNNRLCRNLYAWQAYLRRRSEIDGVSLDSSSAMLTPYMQVYQVVEKTMEFRTITTQYGWHWPSPPTADEICNIFTDKTYIETIWDRKPAMSLVDSAEYDSVIKKEEDADLKRFIYKKRHQYFPESQEPVYVSIEDFKDSLRKLYPSYLDYYFRDGLWADSIKEIKSLSKNAPAQPLPELFNPANACIFASYRRQTSAFKEFGKVYDNDARTSKDADGLDSFEIFKGSSVSPSLSSWNTIRHHLRKLHRELVALAASVFKSLEVYTTNDNHKKEIWNSYLFNLSMKNCNEAAFHNASNDADVEIQSFLDFCKKSHGLFLLGNEPDYSGMFIHILKEQPVNFASLKKLVEYAHSCNYNQKDFLRCISETKIETSGPVFVSRFHSILLYLNEAISVALNRSETLLKEEVVGPAICKSR